MISALSAPVKGIDRGTSRAMIGGVVINNAIYGSGAEAEHHSEHFGLGVKLLAVALMATKL
jgi:hypothetical protein